MKLLISWSGKQSQAVAKALRHWIPKVVPGTKPWMSTLDISPGSRWFDELLQQLEQADFCVICLTPDNVRSPWLYFEAGAIAAKHKEAKVCCYLTGISTPKIGPGPFAEFQAANADVDGTWSIVRAINSALTSNAHDEDLIRTSFYAHWPRLREELKEALLLYDPRNSPDPGLETDDPVTKYDLSGESKELLIEAAADRNGTITMSRTLHGLFLKTNGREIVTPANPRSEARGRSAVRELVQHGLIEDRGHKGEVFGVTAEGYRAADHLKAEQSVPK
jgi:hypothetical protein